MLEDVAIEPGIPDVLLQRKIPGGPVKLLTTLVYRTDYALGEQSDSGLDAATQRAELKYPLHLIPAEFEASMTLCQMARPYSLVDVCLPNCARAAATAASEPERLLAISEGSSVRAAMAEVAQAAWSEDTNSKGEGLVPLPEQ